MNRPLTMYIKYPSFSRIPNLQLLWLKQIIESFQRFEVVAEIEVRIGDDQPAVGGIVVDGGGDGGEEGVVGFDLVVEFVVGDEGFGEGGEGGEGGGGGEGEVFGDVD